MLHIENESICPFVVVIIPYNFDSSLNQFIKGVFILVSGLQ